jgi:hypothetical protein
MKCKDLEGCGMQGLRSTLGQTVPVPRFEMSTTSLRPQELEHCALALVTATELFYVTSGGWCLPSPTLPRLSMS